MSVIERVDAWCRHGDLSVQDLARFRILYALVGLVALPDLGQIADQPPGQFDPPPGPIMLFPSVPPPAALEALELGTAVLLAFLALGFCTRTSSLLLAAALMVGMGLGFSFGKIDHYVLVLLVPAVLAFSGWGGALSVDAHLATREGRPRPTVSSWPARLLAFVIGLAFLTAGLDKIAGGWLSLDSRAVRGYFLNGFVLHDRQDLLAPTMLRLHDVGPLWEALDWFTVALECGLILTVLWWRTFRLGIAVAALFHLGVLQVMNIVFSANVIAYGAFVHWNALRPSDDAAGLPLSRSLAAVTGLLAGGAGYWVAEQDVIPSLGRLLVLVGAAVATVHLSREGWSLVSRRGRSPSPPSRTPRTPAGR